MDIKEKIQEMVEKVTSDESVKADFKKDPIKAVEKVIGVDLPDGAVDKIVDGVKAKLSADKLGDVADKLKNLF